MSETDRREVVFVGAGAIGLPMLSRLAAAGHPVTAVDPAPAARARCAELGVPSVEVFAQAPPAGFVVVVVATPEQLDELVTAALPGLAAGVTWVLMSTVGPDAARRHGGRLTGAGARVLDVPVTGGVARARTGELILFAAGDPVTLAEAGPVLERFGRVRPVGTRIGDGQAVKLVNQHLCSVHLVAAAEALALAEGLGLDPATVLPMVEGGAAGSWMLSDRGPRMLAGPDVEVTSTIGIFVKDARLVAAAAAARDAPVPLLEVARSRFDRAAAAGLTTRDDSRVIETYRDPTTPRETDGSAPTGAPVPEGAPT